MELNSTTLAASIGTVVAATAIYKWINREIPSDIPVLDKDMLQNQSIKDQDGSYCNQKYADIKTDRQLTDNTHQCRTLLELFQRGLRVAGKDKCVGRIVKSSTGELALEWETYSQFYESARRLGSMFKSLGIKRQDFISIYSKNRLEWIKTELACHQFSLVPVPLYDTSSLQATEYIVEKTGVSLFVCETRAHVEKILSLKDKQPCIKYVILLEGILDDLKQKAEAIGVKVFSFQEALDIGEKELREVEPPKETDPAVICFTSGTTGLPKGVDLKHLSVTCNVACLYPYLQSVIGTGDTLLSYLPLPHMYERVAEYTLFSMAGNVAVSRGDVKLLFEDAQLFKPTYFPMVPRLLNRLHDKVKAGVQGSTIKSWLLNKAVEQKKKLLDKGIITRNTIWDRLIFHKVQKLVGGRVKLITTAAAPVHPDVLTFARCAFGCPLVEGYGQTEATAAMTFVYAGDNSYGHVGCPVPGYRIKLVDVPEMNYYVKDGTGEVCGKGRCNCDGYFKDPEKTAELFDEDGWIKTGDIGRMLPNGTLRIVDRKKNILKLAQGVYITPEKIEGIYLTSSVVAQCFVDGDSLKTCTVAVIVPDPDVFPEWCESRGFKGSLQELCENQEVQQAVLTELVDLGKHSSLSSLEQVRALHLTSEPFSIENDLLTPTLKSKRPQLRKYFADVMQDMYKRLGQ